MNIGDRILTEAQFLAIKHSYERGLIPRGSHQAYLYKLVEELTRENRRLENQPRVDTGVNENIQPPNGGRSQKIRVREGLSLRKTTGPIEDSTMEGAS